MYTIKTTKERRTEKKKLHIKNKRAELDKQGRIQDLVQDLTLFLFGPS